MSSATSMACPPGGPQDRSIAAATLEPSRNSMAAPASLSAMTRLTSVSIGMGLTNDTSIARRATGPPCRALHVSSAHKSPWIPCTTGPPVRLRRARNGSTWIALPSPDSAAKAR